MNKFSELSRREPRILGLSEEKLKRNVDFLVNSAGLPLADLVKYPNLFSLSLEKRIIPRYRVIEALKSMQVQELKRETTLRDMVQLTEKDFLDKYVNKNAKSSVLWIFTMVGKLES
jgi:mTERF domain-containing protein